MSFLFRQRARVGTKRPSPYNEVSSMARSSVPTLQNAAKGRRVLVWVSVCVLAIVAVATAIYFTRTPKQTIAYFAKPLPPAPPALNKRDYDLRMMRLSHFTPAATSTATTSRALWPVAAPYPEVGAVLPFKRVVAFYGNFLSKGMGVLGQYPEDVMLAKLNAEMAAWAAADPQTPVIPAIDYIAVTAQASAGRDGMYRAQMSDNQIDHAVELARKIHGIVVLDVQVGLSTLPQELPELRKYLAYPDVHLAIDPEFAMHNGAKPGTVIGTFDATDINYAANFLAQIVREHHLPPKILVIHRFTQEMMTHYKKITPLPEVQIVIDMDGWGDPQKKIGTYVNIVADEPVQFTGFKLFFKNDILPPSTRLLTPKEVINLTPSPIFIQYQ